MKTRPALLAALRDPRTKAAGARARIPDSSVVPKENHHGGFRLSLYGSFWPEAWKVPPGTRPEDFNPYDDDFYDQGADGFRQLLQEIAPSLTEPLTVHAIGHLQGRFPLTACEWHVCPDNPQVPIHEFPHGGDESVVEVLPPERFGSGPPVLPEGHHPPG